jgi:WD40 repeat protein
MDSSLESSSSDGFVAGDIEYVAPEVLENPSLASAKADIWSFGVVLLEMLTGRRPARGHAVDAALAYLPEERASDAQTLLGMILEPKPKVRPAATTVLERVQDARQERCYAKMLEFVNDEVEEVRVRQAERAMVEEQVRDAAAHERDRQMAALQLSVEERVDTELQKYDAVSADRLAHLREVRNAFTDCSKDVRNRAETVAAMDVQSGRTSSDTKICSTTGGADDPLFPRDMESIRNIQAHDRPVLCVAFSATGNLLASASSDKTVRLWDTASFQCNRTLTGHAAAVNSVAFAPEGNQLASASDDKSIRCWNSDTGACTQVLVDRNQHGAQHSDSTPAAGVPQPFTQQALQDAMHATRGHLAAVFSVAFAPSADGKLATGSSDTTVRIWDYEVGDCLRELKGHRGAVFAIAYARSDLGVAAQILASSSYDKTIRLWDIVRNYTCVSVLVEHTSCVRGIAFAATSGTLASASEDKTVRLWESGVGDEGQDDVLHADAPETTEAGAAAMPPSLEEQLDRECAHTLSDHSDYAQCVAFAPHSR